MKRLDWFEILLIVVVMTVSLYAVFADGQNFSWRWFTRDDAYYYFKVAQNISEGHGSTFDGINRTNGYHPLWMLICIPIFALARFDLILPLRVLLVVMSTLSLATGILLYRLIGKIFAPAIGALAAVYWVFSLTVLTRFYKQGLETGIAAFLILLLMYRLFVLERSWRKSPVSRRELITLGAIGALVIFSRLDLVFFVIFVGVWVVFRGSPIRYLLPLDIVAVTFSVLLAFVIQMGLPEYYDVATIAMVMLAVSLLVKIPLAYVLGLYRSDKIRLTGPMIGAVIVLAAVSFMVIALILKVAVTRSFTGFLWIIIIYDAVFTLILFSLIRLLVSGLSTVEEPVLEKKSPAGYFLRNWKQWLYEGIAYYGVAFGALAVYMIWSRFTFGTFSPVSGQIKQWWGSLEGRAYGRSSTTIERFFGLNYSGDSNAWHPVSTIIGYRAELLYKYLKIEDVWRYFILLTLFAILFYCFLLINRNKAKTSIAWLSIIPLFCGAMIQIFYYHMLGYSSYKDWYWITQQILIVLVFSLMLGLLYWRFQRISWLRYAAWGLVAVYGLFLVTSYWGYYQENMTHGEWAADAPYMDISAFLEENTEPGSMIGMTGGGNTAYFIRDRTIINMDGLINSYQYFRLLQQQKAGKYLADEGMDYVLANIGILNSLPYLGQYTEFLEKTGLRYGGKDLARYHATQP